MSTNNDVLYIKMKRNEYCKSIMNSYEYKYINENVNISYGIYSKFLYEGFGIYRCVYDSSVYIHLTKTDRRVYVLYHGQLYPFFIATEFARNYPKEKIDRKKEYLRIKSEIDRLQQEKEQLFIRK